MIWLGSGWPLLSGQGVVLSAKDRDALFQDVVGLSTALREARVTIYDIDEPESTGREFYYESFLKGASSYNNVQIGNLALQVLATQSGSRVLNSGNDIAGSIAYCLVDAKVFYTLSFDSPAADHPNEYHKLQVKIGKRGLTGRTRTGYYTQPWQPVVKVQHAAKGFWRRRGICFVGAPRRCPRIACVAPPCICPCGAQNAATSVAAAGAGSAPKGEGAPVQDLNCCSCFIAGELTITS